MADFLHDVPLADQVAASILRKQAQVLGDRTFVTFAGHNISYAEADLQADRVAAGLSRLGITRGMRVAILLQNRPEYLNLWFGLSRIGAVQVPLNTAYRTPQLLHVLRRTPIATIIVERGLWQELESALPQMPELQTIITLDDDGSMRKSGGLVKSFESMLANGREVPLPEVGGWDPGAVMNTSGTTGPSKGVLLSHAQQYLLGRNIARDLKMTGDDVYYNCFPLFHNTAQAMITIPVLLTGARMVLTERFSATGFWPDIGNHGCTLFYYIGEILRILLKSTAEGDGTGTKLRAGWGIGASPKDFIEFQTRHGVRLRSGYGSTEANVPVFLPEDAPNDVTVGRTIPGFELRIVDERNQPMPAGQTGEIVVRSGEPCAIMLGYDGDPAATVSAWQDLWFHTGDAGSLDTAGNLYFMGRVRDAIRVRGENVSAFEVEEAIGEIEGVLEVAAVAVPCDLGGDEIKAVIVPRQGAVLHPDMVIAHAMKRLPKFAVPRYIEIVEVLPKTETNKVRKNVLRSAPFTAATWDRLAASTTQRQ